MKCLSVRQPWADAIIKGIPVPAGKIFKDVENRSKAYGHRGKTLIHAPQKFDHDGWEWIMETFGCVLKNPEEYQIGGFIGEITIWGNTIDSKSKWAAPGQNNLLLKDPVELPFVEIKGQLGFWNEPTCRVCGCTTYHACEGGCYWVEKDLCSKCKEQCQTCKWSNSEHCKDCFCNELYEGKVW